MSDALKQVEPLHGWRLIAGAFALALANFVVVLDMTIANVSVPHISGGLAVSPTQGTWVITSYAVADAIAVPLTGWLAMRYGTVKWFLISIIAFGVFSFLCGISHTLGLLVAFRILQGFAGGPLMPLSQVLLMSIFPKGKQQIGLGIWAMTTTAAPILGPILGGTISDNWSWPWIFFINLPVVAICGFLVWRLISRYETPVQIKPIDVIGLVLLIVCVGAFQLMLDTGREHDWFESGWIVMLALVSVVGLIAFLIWELTDRHPIVDVRVFKYRGFTMATIALSLGFGAFFSQVVLTPLWLQSTGGYTATETGHIVAWIGVFAVICSPFAAQLIGKIDPRKAVTFGLLWLALMSLLRASWNLDVGYWTLVLPHLLQGLGMPFFFIGLTALAMSSVPESKVVSAASLMGFMRTLAGAIATAVAMSQWDTEAVRVREALIPGMNNADGAMAAMEQAGFGTEQARAMISRLVDMQASTISVLHIYLVAGAIFVVAAACVWFAPRPKKITMGGGH